MYLPPSITEAAFLAAVNKVSRMLARSFVFGSCTVDDIIQQATVFAIEAMARYDTSRPLENFLYTHIKNRLINFRRNTLRQNEPPCISCHNSVDGETAHEDKKYCDSYRSWLKTNTRKHNVLTPLDISNISDEDESGMRDESTVVLDAERNELIALIDEKLPVELRADYLRMRDGCAVPKARRKLIENTILSIVGEL